MQREVIIQKQPQDFCTFLQGELVSHQFQWMEKNYMYENEI